MEVRKRTICQAIFCWDIPWNLGLKNRPNIYGRYLQSIDSWNGHWLMISSGIILPNYPWLYYWLVVWNHGIFNDFPFSWECHHPNWHSNSYFSGVIHCWRKSLVHGASSRTVDVASLVASSGILMFYQAQLEACCCCQQFAYLGRKRLFVSIPSWCDGGINQEIPCKGSFGHVRRRVCYSLTIEPVTVWINSPGLWQRNVLYHPLSMIPVPPSLQFGFLEWPLIFLICLKELSSVQNPGWLMIIGDYTTKYIWNHMEL